MKERDFEYARSVLNSKIGELNSDRQYGGDVQSRIDELVVAVRILSLGKGILTKEPPIKVVPFNEL